MYMNFFWFSFQSGSEQQSMNADWVDYESSLPNSEMEDILYQFGRL